MSRIYRILLTLVLLISGAFADITISGDARVRPRLDITDAGSYIVSVALTYEDGGEYGLIDVKERGGDTEKVKTELEKLGTTKELEFRPSGRDKLLKFN